MGRRRVSCFLEPARPGSDGPQVGCRIGSECVSGPCAAVPADCAPSPGPHCSTPHPALITKAKRSRALRRRPVGWEMRMLILAGLHSDRCCFHQQYLSDAKNPARSCLDHGTDVSCPIGVMSADG